ncbi:hypothetical protein E3N88_14280 [Mikania micrantha]|uniref:Uncharacterized protein n=1 Tax=Mikania micrantha TaxID=192012 RepID=A0A5N6P0Y7_9ASTR|nr:hypothetical protein E3N88_14280 [Mikania micrantha]
MSCGVNSEDALPITPDMSAELEEQNDMEVVIEEQEGLNSTEVGSNYAVRPLSDEERASKEQEDKSAKVVPINLEKGDEGFVIVKNRKNGNFGRKVRFQQPYTTYNRAGATDLRGSVGNETADR